MNAAEVIEREVRRERRLEVRPLLREGISETSKTACVDPDRQVLPLDVGSVDATSRMKDS